MKIHKRLCALCLAALFMGATAQFAHATPPGGHGGHGPEHALTIPMPPPALIVPPLHFRTVIPDSLPNRPSPASPRQSPDDTTSTQNTNTPNGADGARRR